MPVFIKEMHYGLLLGSKVSPEPEESDSTSFRILAEGAVVSKRTREEHLECFPKFAVAIRFQIPAAVTTYWCVIKRIPYVVAGQKHHIIQVGGHIPLLAKQPNQANLPIQMNPYVKEGNENLVHHMEVRPICYLITTIS